MIYFILFDQTPKVRLARLGALCCIAFFVGWIFVSVVRTAEPDSRLAQIQAQRLLANKDVSIAQLLMENAQMRLKTLEEEEQKIKAEVKGKDGEKAIAK